MILADIANFVRWRDWGPGKIPILCTQVANIGLVTHDYSPTFIIFFILYLGFAVIHSALGYVVNNFGDRVVDGLQGKNNPFQKLTQSQGLAILAAMAALAFLSGLPFINRSYFLWLWILWAFFALSYSLKPIRLKERGKWGLAISATAQWTLPVMLTFAAFGRFGKADMIVFVCANTISGATLEIAHQRWDRSRDRETNTKTFGVQTDNTKLDRIYRTALFLDKVAIGSILVTVLVYCSALSFLLCLPLLSAYIVLLTISIREISQASRLGMILDPYYSSTRSANKFLHETVPNFLIPSFVLMLITVMQPLNILLLLAFLYWRIILGQADWRWFIGAVKSLSGR